MDVFAPVTKQPESSSGQDIGHADGPQGYYDYVLGLHERTGKWPAIIGTDYLIHHGSVSFLDVDRKTRILADYWKAGGLVTVYAHLGNPWTGGDAWDTSSGTGRYSDAYTPGTPAYANLKEEFRSSRPGYSSTCRAQGSPYCSARSTR